MEVVKQGKSGSLGAATHAESHTTNLIQCNLQNLTTLQQKFTELITES